MPRKRSALLVAFVLLPAALCAQDRKTALADELFTSMKMEKMMDQMKQQMPMMIQQQIQQMNLSAADKAKTDKLVQEMTAYVTDTFDWKKLRPEYVSIYAEVFNEQELQGLVDFYKSPPGQAFIDKMPVVMTRAMQVQQKQMGAVMAHMQELVKQMKSDSAAGSANK